MAEESSLQEHHARLARLRELVTQEEWDALVQQRIDMIQVVAGVDLGA